MEDLGPACAKTEASFIELLEKFPGLTELDVAKILGLIARTSVDSGISPNVSHYNSRVLI